MQKLEIEVKFIKICCRQLRKQSKPIMIALYNEEGECIMNGQTKIQANQPTVQLDEFSEFQFFLIINQQKQVFSPFKLLFFTQNQGETSRKIELNTNKIYEYYLQDLENPSVSTLDLIYSFDFGQLFYQVAILNAQNIQDQQQQNKYKNKFEQTQIILNHQDQQIHQESDIQEVNLGDDLPNINRKNGTDKKEQFHLQQIISQIQSPSSIEPREHNYWQTNAKDNQGNTIPSELQTSKRKVQWPNSDIKSHFKHEVYFSEEKQEHKGVGIKVKMLICLLIFGLAFLIFNLEGGPSKRKLHHRPTIKRTQSK